YSCSSTELGAPSHAAIVLASTCPATSPFCHGQTGGQPLHSHYMLADPDENSEVDKDVDTAPLQTAIFAGKSSHRSLYGTASNPTSTLCPSRLSPIQSACNNGLSVEPGDVVYSTKVPDRGSSLQDEWLVGTHTNSETGIGLDSACDESGWSPDSWPLPRSAEHCQGQMSLSPAGAFPDLSTVGTRCPLDYPKQVASIIQLPKPTSPSYSRSCSPTASALNMDANFSGMDFSAGHPSLASPSRVFDATTLEGGNTAFLTAGGVEPPVRNYLSLPSASMRILPPPLDLSNPISCPHLIRRDKYHQRLQLQDLDGQQWRNKCAQLGMVTTLGPQRRAIIDIRSPMCVYAGGGGLAGGQHLQQALPGIPHPQLPPCRSDLPPGFNASPCRLARPSIGSPTSNIGISGAVSTLFDTCHASALASNHNLWTPNVYINGLPPHFPEDQLFAMVSAFGEVRSVRTFTREGRDIESGYGFVLFETIAAAENCISTLRRHRNLHPTFCKQFHKIPGMAYTQHYTARDGPDLGLLSGEASFEARMQSLQDPMNTNLYMEGLPLGVDQYVCIIESSVESPEPHMCS
ncbi:hypothetical protein CVT26_006450, partial [Gymnopilus dilepis]